MSRSTSASEARQLRVADWLEGKHSDLASMYRTARALLEEIGNPGDERVRVSLICHSMREVMNRLPGALGIKGADSRGSRSSTHVQELATVAERYPNLDLVQDAENVPVPHELAAVLHDLIKAAVAEDVRVVAKPAALLTDDRNPRHPAVREWNSLVKFFVKWAHLHDKQSSVEEIPSDNDLRWRIELAESLIDGIRAEFFDSLHEIEDILAEANRTTGSEGR